MRRAGGGNREHVTSTYRRALPNHAARTVSALLRSHEEWLVQRKGTLIVLSELFRYIPDSAHDCKKVEAVLHCMTIARASASMAQHAVEHYTYAAERSSALLAALRCAALRCVCDSGRTSDQRPFKPNFEGPGPCTTALRSAVESATTAGECTRSAKPMWRVCPTGLDIRPCRDYGSRVVLGSRAAVAACVNFGV